MANPIGLLVRVLSSQALAIVLLVLLALLTWLGTLEQVENGLFATQRKYFDSLFLLHDFGPLSIPLPGATLVMGVLFVNLVLGGIVRMQRGLSTLGVLITHAGILLLFLAGFVKAYFAQEGHVTLYEGESATAFRSYHRWELAALERLSDGAVREHAAPEELFRSADGSRTVLLASSELPFRVELVRFVANSRPLPKGPMVDAALPVVDGFFLDPLARETEEGANLAGAYVAIVEPEGRRLEAILWGASRAPFTFDVEGRTFGLELRRERYPIPFTVTLRDFVKEDHPRMNMPKAFSSAIDVTEGGSTRPVKIEMNEPLRSHGLVMYQSSWGPSNARPGDPLFSTLAVVRNPADQYPLYACIVIAIGLTLHYARKLFRHVKAEVEAR